jgi:hypothetical protein
MNLGLESDLANPNFAGARNPDTALHVRFYNRAVKNQYASDEQKRPIFEDKIYVEIHTPGNNLNVIDVPARDDHKARFPLQWAHYNNTQGDESKAGTPVEQWGGLTAAQVEMLKAQKFYTVEMIAFASDLQIQSVGMIAGMSPLAFRERAKLWLQASTADASNSGLLEQLEAEKKARADLEARLARLEAGAAPAPQLEAQDAEPPKELKAGTPEAEQAMELSQLRMSFEALTKKKPDQRWGLDRLRVELENLTKETVHL